MPFVDKNINFNKNKNRIKNGKSHTHFLETPAFRFSSNKNHELEVLRNIQIFLRYWFFGVLGFRYLDPGEGDLANVLAKYFFC